MIGKEKAPAFEVELNLSDYWVVIRKRFLSVLFVFALTVTGAAIITQFQRPLYRAQALIKYEPPSAVMGGMTAMLNLTAGAQTQVSLLGSQEMLQRVAAKGGVPVASLQKAYKADKLGQTSLITITAVSDRGEKASNLANLVADTFIEWDLDVRSRQLRKTLNDVAARAKDVQDDLLKLEDQRKRFLEAHETTGLTQAMASSLLELESRRRELLRKFTSAHPDIRKLEERIQLMRNRLNALPAEQEEMTRLNRDIKVREDTYVALARQMAESRIALESTVSYVSILSRASPSSQPFSPNRPVNYGLGVLLGLVLGFLTAFIVESLDISITTIEDIEKVVEAPVLGVIPHFGSESRWQDILISFLKKDRHPEDLFRSFLIFRHAPKSPVIEVYHTLRVNIQAQVAKPQNMVLTFTSTGVAEGKTLTSSNFAMAAAHSGLKTLLIAADVRRPSLHRIFGLPKEPGLIEAITGRVPWRDTVRGTVDYLMGEQDLDKLAAFPGIENLKMMTGWTASTAEVVNLFSSARLPRLIAEMRSDFDVVVFDCPPVLLFVDAMLIGQHTDGVVLVYKSGKMARRALKRAKDQVVLSHGKILGIALNDAHAAAMEPGYGYYSDYGHYAKSGNDPS